MEPRPKNARNRVIVPGNSHLVRCGTGQMNCLRGPVQTSVAPMTARSGHKCNNDAAGRNCTPSLLFSTCRKHSALGEQPKGTVPMRSKLLISAAALLAGMAMASAQTMPHGGGGQPN